MSMRPSETFQLRKVLESVDATWQRICKASKLTILEDQHTNQRTIVICQGNDVLLRHAILSKDKADFKKDTKGLWCQWFIAKDTARNRKGFAISIYFKRSRQQDMEAFANAFQST